MSNPHEEPATLINQIIATLFLKQRCSRDMHGLANQLIAEALVQIWVETYDDAPEADWDEFQWVIGSTAQSLLEQRFIILNTDGKCHLNPILLKVHV